jgi:hypothetical protein
MQGMQGSEPKLHKGKTDCIGVNTANLYGAEFGRKPYIPCIGHDSVTREQSAPFERKVSATDRPELEAAATRSNLTTFTPGDRVYVAHQLLPHGRLHPATITKVVNASIYFTPPIEGLLNDPDDPDAGEWPPSHPPQTANANNCSPELGTTKDRPRRHPDPQPAHYEPLDQNGLEEFLREIQEEDKLIAVGLRNLQYAMEAA